MFSGTMLNTQTQNLSSSELICKYLHQPESSMCLCVCACMCVCLCVMMIIHVCITDGICICQ